MTTDKSALLSGKPNPAIANQAPAQTPTYRVVPLGVDGGEQTFEIRVPSKEEIEGESAQSR